MRGERVVVGKGKTAHLRHDEHYTYCGIGEVDNSRSTEGLKLCQRCEILKEIDLKKLSKQNGKSELENAKMITELLMVKANASDMDIKVTYGDNTGELQMVKKCQDTAMMNLPKS